VAYTQRPGASTLDYLPDFSALCKDPYRVIDYVNNNSTLSQHIDRNKLGLLGHRLGSWVVTMAACSDTGFLKQYYSKLKIVVEGGGARQLERSMWIYTQPHEKSPLGKRLDDTINQELGGY